MIRPIRAGLHCIFGRMMRILVNGSRSQLGRSLMRKQRDFEWTFLGREDLDMEKVSEISAALDKREFDVFINAAAYTAVDAAEAEPEKARKINALALQPIAEVCHKKNSLLIHISTDYVFGEKPAIPLREDQPTDPQGVYARTKCEGEEIVQATCAKHIIIRTSWLYGPDGVNFVKTMLKLSESKTALNVVFDQTGNPTLVDHLAEAIVQIAAAYSANPENFPFGKYHYSNEGVGTWYDFAHAVFALSQKNMHLTPVRSEVFGAKAKRPAYSVLDKQKIKDTFGLAIPHWRDALAECLNAMRENND